MESNPIYRVMVRGIGLRLLVVAVLVVGLVGAARPALAHIAPAPIPVSGTPMLISGGSGNQTDPHISGTLVSYTNRADLTSEIRYHDLATGADAAIPTGDQLDMLSGVSGNTIVFRRTSTADVTTRSIMRFDASMPSVSPVELAPVPGIWRSYPAIGGRTVAWMEFPPTTSLGSNIVAFDLETGQAVPLTIDDRTVSNQDPAVSPDGSTITWNKCNIYGTDCRIFVARSSADGTWTTIELNNSDGDDFSPDTNGQVVAYTSNAGGDLDIFWENVDGTGEHQLPMPGAQFYPSMQGSLIAFQSEAEGSTVGDLYVYDLVTGKLYQVTNTPTVDESLSDISLAPDGSVWMAWAQPDGLTPGHYDVYALNFSITSANVPPVLGPIAAPTDPVAVGTPVTASANFTDANPSDTHTVTIEWGDGTTSVAAVVETNGSGSASGSHTYAAAGVYTLKLTVTDNHGGADSEIFQYVVVYDPNAGFVTGGGWIYSPAGAYAADPALTGRATFGFVSKYQKGAMTPTGQTQFQFQAGSLSFRSSSYEWLVISGPRAQYKGEGAINGSGTYGFMLTAQDGQVSGGGGVDRFRIKIWDKVTGSVVYDNQMGDAEDGAASDAVESGSIIIHRK